MSQSACPTPEELSRQLSLGPDEVFSSHLSSCSKCSQALEAESSLLGMFRELPWGEPPAAQVSGVRSVILQQASQQQSIAPASARWPWARLALVAVLLLAVGATLYLSLSAPQQNKTPALALANVEATANSQYVYEGPKDNEVVRLQEGTVMVQVTHLKPGERFRVIIGDAEVEVRGTKFSVTAKDNKLVRVVVFEGKVEVRPAKGEQRLLLPSQAWDVEKDLVPVTATNTQPTTLAVAPEDPKTLVKDPKIPKDEPKVSRSTSEEAFDAGFALMREANFEAASESFLLAATLDPKASIVEDARFWYATALNRAGKKAQAQTALTAFVAKYPNSPRRGEAAVSLGKLLLNSGDLEGAQIMFESAQDDAVSVVQKSAKDGLAAVTKKRAATPTTQPQ
jgi:tetratricopeptide (TPR) repeat protein